MVTVCGAHSATQLVVLLCIYIYVLNSADSQPETNDSLDIIPKFP